MECREDMIIPADFTVDGGYRAMAKALEEGMECFPDAIYFGSDATAAGGMIALEVHLKSKPPLQATEYQTCNAAKQRGI